MNGVVVFDKPQGFTSHDAAAKLRGVYKTKRTGHSGTLDPMATGVLPIFLGGATKAIPLLTDERKSYTATVKTGLRTDTADITGAVVETGSPLTREAVERALPFFLGETEQTPPIYSAISVGGKRLYKLAREGKSVEIPKRKITVTRLALLSFSDGCFTFEVDCSKGAYVRSLGEDICRAAGGIGTLTALRRTRSGIFCEGDCVTLDRLCESPQEFLLPVERLFTELPRLYLNDELLRLFLNGVRLDIIRTKAAADTRYAVYGKDGFIGIGETDDKLLYKLAAFLERE